MPGKWHNNMEKLFPENMREVKFYCSTITSNTCRRADICLSNNRTCEIQHSYISENEITKRFHDWNKFGKQIIWLIDGNNGVHIDKLSTGNYLLIFEQKWKYQSFIKTYDFILLEKNGLIFKIELIKIKSGMIELSESKTVEETIKFLKTKPDKIWDFWGDENVVKSQLSVYQQGAGNGKTYGIWKSITENIDRKTYIIITKQHSARNVIYAELMDQKKRFENGEEIFHIDNITNDTITTKKKHYILQYTHKISKRTCKVIIGTIDSFCFNLSDSNSKGSDFYKGIIDNIRSNGPTKMINGYIKFGGEYIQLSKESEIWIDEVQDLQENYFHAMVKLMLVTSCSINIVGDKLQSLSFPNNFLNSIFKEGLPNIKINIKKSINKNRRIKVTNMAEEINKLIPFNKYNLPIIQCDDNIEKINNDEPIKIIDSPAIYANDTNNKKVNNYCDKILQHYKYQVKTNNYNPNDFLIVFPIMKMNVIASELQTKIQEFWTEIYSSQCTQYTQYAYLHKHTEGKVINTNDSINATRIMSIQSSKGDGRKVVFILGVNEKSLKLVSNNKKGLLYDSHLHVALTRAKYQIYFGLTKNNDNIHQLFGNTGYVELMPSISKKISLDKIISLIDKQSIIECLYKNDITFENIMNKNENTQQKESVDWGYHCIKYTTFYYMVILNIINNKTNNLSKGDSQLFVILDIISNYNIIKFPVRKFYKVLKEFQYKNLPVFPLCELSNKPEYRKYCNIILQSMKKIQHHIKKKLLHELNIYDSIILVYMIQIQTSQNYADMSPMDIYNITDFFQMNQNSNKERKLLQDLDNIKNIIQTSGLTTHNNINWNIFKHIELNSKYDYFKINKLQFPIIGNNKKDIIHIKLKSNVSKLNFWDIMIEILLERFLIYNPKSEKDKKRFLNKNITSLIFLLDTNQVITIKWDWDKSLTPYIKNELKSVLEKYYKSNHKNIYKYFDYIKKNKHEIWKESPDIIINQILETCNNMKGFPDYIIKIFQNINSKIEDDDDYDFVNEFETFNKQLEKKLELYLNKYLKK
jgi:hypothetical protein